MEQARHIGVGATRRKIFLLVKIALQCFGCAAAGSGDPVLRRLVSHRAAATEAVERPEVCAAAPDGDLSGLCLLADPRDRRRSREL